MKKQFITRLVLSLFCLAKMISGVSAMTWMSAFSFSQAETYAFCKQINDLD